MDFPYGGMGLFQGLLGGIDFSINQVLNRGAAWGIFSQYQDLLIYLRLVLIGAVVVYLAFFNASVARAFFLTLVVAGALGNVIDYFKYGYVIDFFHFKFWGYSYPLFNIADIAICVGVILLIIHTLAFSDPQRAGHKTKTKRCK
jgi:signal peptidase II